MQRLGPLFADRCVTGPLLIQYFELFGAHFYFIGESHVLNGRDDTNAHHVIEQLKTYGKTNRVVCYCEATENDIQYNAYHLEERMYLRNTKNILDVATSPLNAYIGYAHVRKELGNCETVCSEIRRYPPFDVYTMMVRPIAYMLDRYNTMMNPEIETKVRKWSKLAEKMIIKHIATRDQAKWFLESLCLANLDYPKWFVQLYEKIHETKDQPLPTPLRVKMHRLREQNVALYDRVVVHIRSYYENWAVTPYTAAIEKIEDMRHTAASKVVAQTDTDTFRVFVELTTFLFDISVILDVLLNEHQIKQGNTVVVLAGAAHAEHLASFFEPLVGNDKMCHKYGANGVLPAGPPLSGIHNFQRSIPRRLRQLAATS